MNSARPLRIMMLSWEYPPVVVGGLGRHVHALATSLAAAGHHVTVVTRHAPGAPIEEDAEGVHIVRAPEDPPLFALATPTLLAWTMAFNHTLTRAALRAADAGEFDVVHAHDWLVTHTAVTIAEHLERPLVATIHATEAGRHQGWLPDDLNRSIHSVEWWLGHEASRVLVCSAYMKWEVTRLLELPAAKVEAIPNGVDSSMWKAAPAAVKAARLRYAGEGPLVGFAGRLVYEKGVQHLVSAIPQMRDEHPGLRVVIAGDGPYRSELMDAARKLKLQRTVSFTGFLNERELPAVLAATDATVVPSLYEPFGMVALEAAAAGAPLAVADTGGLAEIVESGVTGVTFPHSDPDALATAVGSLLSAPEHAQSLARQALTMIGERYGWQSIAAKTAGAYYAAIDEEPLVRAERIAALALAERPQIVIGEGNLLR
ncbi:glycogen(starch) synthase [Allocatelliglobosispora scoriae]|uniref:Glycogen(Starch) synthase n=1 Tax=Allocatelliglobosispora scoriae TaxID=643052 RepID=A0A841BZ99_9ACTN|nr:glycosyltransferase family 4 protein [Allocatelliglobosispora scoriae]MBB5872818.1 glycogen(starch) synthase [Allocatelliglobosispora scoriae]